MFGEGFIPLAGITMLDIPFDIFRHVWPIIQICEGVVGFVTVCVSADLGVMGFVEENSSCGFGNAKAVFVPKEVVFVCESFCICGVVVVDFFYDGTKAGRLRCVFLYVIE